MKDVPDHLSVNLTTAEVHGNPHAAIVAVSGFLGLRLHRFMHGKTQHQ